ncbi:hypothetical protein [Streptomyces subrutilus]|uniref:Uncharacterized protein n=1 Tax=Streptomyces subrutilus TaxID=36818 RepID=A0A1E5PU20_9ACTN|nr:hypothetical protein [Streptomyces subrutilus]OEJ33088.1 hypothetical protein BGK67_18755 [Streptomyces subrutilus]
MAKTPKVVVGAPDERGLRKVLVDGERVGRARSLRELRRILDRAGVAPGYEISYLGEDSTVWPDRTWLRRGTCLFMVAGLAVTAWPLFQIGLSDSGDALTYGGRIAGLSILVVAVVEALSVVAALDYWDKRQWRYSGVLVLVGVVIALLCSVALLVLQVGERFSNYTVIGIALGIWSLVALFVLFKSEAWKGLRIPRKIAIGVIISTLLAGANLAYAQIYVPYVTTPLILTGASFKESNLEAGAAKLYVTVHLYVKNAGEVPVYILGSSYWVRGEPARSKSVDKADKSELIYDGEFVSPDGHVLNPGEEVAQDAVVEIKNPDPRKYEALTAQTEVYVIRKDRMKLTGDYEKSRVSGKTLKESLTKDDPVNPKYKYVTGMSNSSEILNVTRGPQRVTVWRLDRPMWPTVIVDVSPPDQRIAFKSDRPPLNRKAIERYGLSQERGSMAQTPYPELLERARSIEKGATPPPIAPPTPAG